MSLVQELNSLDFEVYIGGPLQAAINAQQSASIAQAEFIKTIGMDEEKKLRYVDFTHKKRIPNPEYDPTTDEDEANPKYLEQEVLITVPFLSILSVPALRIDEVVIDFNAKLTSVETRQSSAESNFALEVGGKVWGVRFKASAAYKRTTSSSSTIEKTYNLGVHVRAVNDELPAGLARVLDMMEDSIAAQVLPLPAPVEAPAT